MDASTAFNAFASELIEGLARQGFTLEPAQNGRVLYKGFEKPAGKVLSWKPAALIDRVAFKELETGKDYQNKNNVLTQFSRDDRVGNEFRLECVPFRRR